MQVTKIKYAAKYVICFWLMTLGGHFVLLAQNNSKGLGAVINASNSGVGKTYALIMGISKYKNPAIPPLQYADVDAIAFKNYLLAIGVDAKDITLLINEDATNGEFWTNISNLTETAKQGDRVFIYFSGHGDVENRTIVKDAYLLPYDAPKCVYPAGAIAIPLLKSWIATMSSNGIQAIFIADACHSGNLAGGKEGMEAAANMLKDKWQDEIKMLSCQPGELSLEGNQWGGGRGLFSYVLINGLAGMADRNNDGNISLRELNLYMMEKVPEEADPMPQNPMLSGDMESGIAKVDAKVLASISKQSNQQGELHSHGFDESLLTNQDDEIKQNARFFQLYLDSSILFRLRNDPSAYFYASKIPKTESTKKLVATIQQKLSSGMLTEIHAMIESMLDNNFNPYSIPRKELIRVSKEASIVRSYMGDSTLQSMGLLSRILFGEAMKGIFDSEGMNPDLVIEKLDSAITLDPKGAHCYLWKGLILQVKKDNLELAIVQHKIAISLSPKFVLPYLSLEEIYQQRQLWDSAVVVLEQTLPFYASFEIYNKLCIDYDNLGKKDSVQVYLTKLLQSFSDMYDNTGYIQYKANNLMVIGDLFAILGNSARALEYYHEAYQLDSTVFGDRSFYNYACYYSLMKDTGNALKMFEAALNKGWNDYGWIVQDTDLDAIRQLPEFNALLKKYFPGKL